MSQQSGRDFEVSKFNLRRVKMRSAYAKSDVCTATKTIMEEVKNEFPDAELLYPDKTYPYFKIEFAENDRES